MDLPSSSRPRNLRILFATVSGTARQVAEAMYMEACDEPGLCVALADMHDAGPVEAFAPLDELLILCIATTGSGDVPDDGQAAYENLRTNPKYLGGLRYGLVALGDSSYGATFCGGALHFEALLQDLGATRIGEILQLDAMEEAEPEQAAVQWFREWVKKADLAT